MRRPPEREPDAPGDVTEDADCVNRRTVACCLYPAISIPNRHEGPPCGDSGARHKTAPGGDWGWSHRGLWPKARAVPAPRLDLECSSHGEAPTHQYFAPLAAPVNPSPTSS